MMIMEIVKLTLFNDTIQSINYQVTLGVTEGFIDTLINAFIYFTGGAFTGFVITKLFT